MLDVRHFCVVIPMAIQCVISRALKSLGSKAVDYMHSKSNLSSDANDHCRGSRHLSKRVEVLPQAKDYHLKGAADASSASFSSLYLFAACGLGTTTETHSV